VSAIPGETQTLAAAIYAFTQTPDGDEAALALTLVAVCLSLLALLASEWLSRRVRSAA
jgi:molybdate transport system permease protein